MSVNNERDSGIREMKDVYKRFSKAIFTISNGRLIATLVVNLGKRNVNRVDFQKRATETFGQNAPRMISFKETKTSGVFYVPRQSFDSTIWSDLVMNNPLFYDILAVDESVRMSKTKKNVFMKALYGSETFALQMNKGEKGELPPGVLVQESYVRVRIAKTTTIDRIASLQTLIGQLIAVYNNEFPNVSAEYKQYIPKFSPVALVTAVSRPFVRKLALTDIAPDIFPPRYSRQCPRSPIIISDEEASQTNKVVMKFPIYGESTTRNFICPDTAAPYPGLQPNNRPDNNDLFPFVPCCYAMDQRYKPGSAYNSYYNNEEFRRGTQIQEVFKTGKLLPVSAVGNLPKKIDDFFNTFLTPDKQIMRRGMTATRLTFLESVLVAKLKIIGGKHRRDSPVEDLTKHLNGLLTRELAAAAKQELHSKSVDEILTIMKTGDLRATLFVNVLEIAFDCNIYIFTDANGGTLTLPDHVMTYYKLKPSKDTILIYQHWGSEADAPKYPHCELMVVADRENVKNQQLMFSFDSPVAQAVSQAFTRLNRKFGPTIVALQPVLVKKIPFLFQYVDAYGKCRMVCSEFEDERITLMLPPCPPFALPIDSQIYHTSLKSATRFCEQFDLSILEQKKIRSNRTVEVIVTLGSINGVILVDDDIYIKDVPVFDNPSFRIFNNVETPMKDSLKFAKTARVLQDVAVWKLSKYLDGSRLSRDSFLRFIDENFVIVSDIEYDVDSMRPYFEDDSNKMIDNGKLVVPNNEVRKRLVYHLAHIWRSQSEEFDKYRDMTNIPSFFSSVNDFKTVSGEYVLEKKQAVSNLIETKKRDSHWKIVDRVQKETDEPYFFRNSLVSDEAFVAQNAPTYLHANYIVNQWRTRGVNPGTFFRIERPQELTREEPVQETISTAVAPSTVETAEEAMDISELSGLEVFEMEIEELLGEQEVVPLREQPSTIRLRSTKASRKRESVKESEKIAPLLPTIELEAFTIVKYVNSEDMTILQNFGMREIVLAFKIADEPRYTVLMRG